MALISKKLTLFTGFNLTVKYDSLGLLMIRNDETPQCSAVAYKQRNYTFNSSRHELQYVHVDQLSAVFVTALNTLNCAVKNVIIKI